MEVFWYVIGTGLLLYLLSQVRRELARMGAETQTIRQRITGLEQQLEALVKGLSSGKVVSTELPPTVEQVVPADSSPYAPPVPAEARPIEPPPAWEPEPGAVAPEIDFRPLPSFDKQLEELLQPEPSLAAASATEALMREETLASPGFGRDAVNPPPSRPVAPASAAGSSGIDWEKFIGENLINKLGIGILTIGIGIFVKYAIDQNWINEVGRVLIGLAAGGILAGVAHWLRKDYGAFSSVLIGGAIAVFYFTIGLAFHQYHLFSQTVAFILMVAITGLGVFFSHAYNRQELGVIALLGGFATPLMVSTGSGNYIVLFNYLLILNGGMLALSYSKKWNIVYLASYLCTLLLFGGWLSNSYLPAQWLGGLAFATAFYFVFYAAISAFNLRTGALFRGQDFMLLLGLNLAYYSAGLYMIESAGHGDLKGLYTLGVAAVNLAYAFVLYRRANMDRNFVYLVIGLVLTYVTLAGPIQLNGNQITLFWAAEAVLLLWLYGRTGMGVLMAGAAILPFLAGFSLVMDWGEGYTIAQPDGEPLRIVFNKPFLSGLFSLLALVAYRWQLLRLPKLSLPFEATAEGLAKGVEYAILGLGYLTGLFELIYQLSWVDTGTTPKLALLGAAFYTAVWVVALQFWAVRTYRLNWIQAASLGVVILCGAHILILPTLVAHMRYEVFVEGTRPFWQFGLQYGLLGILIAGVVATCRYVARYNRTYMDLAVWAFGIYGVVQLALQLDHLAVLFYGQNGLAAYEQALETTHRVIYPIAWGLTGFGMVAEGIRHKLRPLRIFGLLLFALIILKLLVLDLARMSAGGRIATFISLGVLLLTVSFLYQKLKALLAADESAAAALETPPPTPLPDAPEDDTVL